MHYRFLFFRPCTRDPELRMSISGNVILPPAAELGAPVSRTGSAHHVGPLSSDDYDIVRLSDGHAMISYEVVPRPAIHQIVPIPREKIAVFTVEGKTVLQVEFWCYQAFLQLSSEPAYGRVGQLLMFCDKLPRRQVQMKGDAGAREKLRRCWDFLRRGRPAEPASKLGEIMDR